MLEHIFIRFAGVPDFYRGSHQAGVLEWIILIRFLLDSNLIFQLKYLLFEGLW